MVLKKKRNKSAQKILRLDSTFTSSRRVIAIIARSNAQRDECPIRLSDHVTATGFVTGPALSGDMSGLA